MVILLLSDFDPDGEEIAHSFARSMRDDFGIADIAPIKVAITEEQVERFNLPPQMMAKETSTNYEKFSLKHGDYVYELEALPPKTLQKLFRDAVDKVIDRKLCNTELDLEKLEAAKLKVYRDNVKSLLSSQCA